MKRPLMLLAWLACTNSLVLCAEPIDRMSLAADALDRGDATTAIAHLSAHVRQTPEDAMTRALLAELLFKQEQWLASSQEFHRFVESAQGLTGPVNAHLVHAHTRLMTIAEKQGDAHTEELNRGIGLYRLVLRWNAEPGHQDESLSRETLWKAVRALKSAQQCTLRCPRSSFYLAKVYFELGQLASARAALRHAQACPPSGLTHCEAEELAQYSVGSESLPLTQDVPTFLHRGER